MGIVGCSNSDDSGDDSTGLNPKSAAAASASVDMQALSQPQAPAPLPAPGAPAQAAASAGNMSAAQTEISSDTQQALEQLNMILTGTFESEIGRKPTGVNEFVERGLIRQLPASPAGKKFFFDADKNQIVLADRLPGEVDPAPLSAEQAQAAYLKTMQDIHKRIGGSN